MEHAKNIVERFSIEQCRKLYLVEEFEISKLLYQDMTEVFSNNKKTTDSNDISLDKAEARRLKHLITSYLNLLESILVAWQYSIADKEIIENEFSSLYDTKVGHNFLQKLSYCMWK